jgi:2-oxoglutarate ferredoxin oxidoreductase subunit beta
LTDFEKYLRVDKLPFIWCSGCGNGIVLKAILMAVDRLRLDQDRIVMVSGIGCSSRATGYVDCNTLHTTHGRAIAFATGIKLARPDLSVIVLTGDGDATAIGGNHFIHAARRNIDLTVVLFNNWIYGMTGGQLSPTTPHGMRATTAPHGNPEGSFDIARLAVCAGAAYVARGTVSQPRKLSRYIQQGLGKRGFSLIEAFTPCPTAFGRQNRLGRPVDNLLWMRENTVDVEAAQSLADEEREGKLIVGVLADVEKPDYAELYESLVRRARDEEPEPALPGRDIVTAWSEQDEGRLP